MQFVHKTIETKSRRICSVPQCSTYCTKHVSLYSFPSDPKLRKAWQIALKIGKPITKYMLVCSLHLTENDFTISSSQATSKLRRLKKQAIPSQNIPKLSLSTKKVVSSRSDRHWLQKCTLGMLEAEEEDRMETEEVANVTHLLGNKADDRDTDQDLAQPSTSRGHISTNLPPLTNVFSSDKETQSDLCQFFTFSDILNTDEKLMNFTGINTDILKTISKCAENTATYNNCNWVNMEERIILVLCKLKLNLSFACLAVLFNNGKNTCRNMFYVTLSRLAVSLKPAIYWPTKEEIAKNMPKCFDKFRSTRVVLDCTEIKIQKLKCLKCRIMSYSHYKGTHTLKYLIGITPSGLISFVSAGFGGRATDKAIFNYEKIIDKLDMQDAVMVDKGILIEKECEEKFVKLIRPPFLKQQKQFSKKDADRTAEISRARVHVERAIQRLKIFKILHEQFNWYMIPYSDEIVTVIAAIVNLSSPILANKRFF